MFAEICMFLFMFLFMFWLSVWSRHTGLCRTIDWREFPLKLYTTSRTCALCESWDNHTINNGHDFNHLIIYCINLTHRPAEITWVTLFTCQKWKQAGQNTGDLWLSWLRIMMIIKLSFCWNLNKPNCNHSCLWWETMETCRTNHSCIRGRWTRSWSPSRHF